MKLKRKLILCLMSISILIANLAIEGCATTQTNYEDVDKEAWYTEAVNYVAEEQIMVGIGNNRFSPQGSVTRAQAVQVLYALSKKKSTTPNVTTKIDTIFVDVKNEAWYAEALSWAYPRFIMGYPDGTFRPDRLITREEFSAILWSFAMQDGKTREWNKDISSFPDYNEVSEYARYPLCWMFSHGLINGTGKGLEPKSYLTRAQLAMIMFRYKDVREENINDIVIPAS